MTPTAEDVDRALDLASKLYANYVYLFEHLNTPDWIQPLKERGRFATPPPPITHEDGAQSFPTWPELEYLARMASAAPDQVFAILKALPETANVMVHRDIVAGALELPVQMRAKLGEREAAWARQQEWFFWLIPEKFAELAKSLAEAGAGSAALQLMRALLEPRPDGNAKMPYYDYERTIEIAGDALVQAEPWATLEMFIGLLHRSIAQEREGKSIEDFSAIWRPAVEDHEQNRHYEDVRDGLVSALRDSADWIAGQLPGATERVVATLEQREFTIFRRLALYVLARHAGDARAEARARLMDVALMDEAHVRHEYAQLAKAALALLSESDQNSVLTATSSFFDEPGFRARVEARFERPPTDDELTRAREADEREHLALFEGSLPGRWKTRYEDLIARLGRIEHPDFPFYSEAALVGPTSPRAADDLSAMNIDELLDYLRTWKPSGEVMSPSYEGLGRQLQEMVQRDPARYASAAAQFTGLEPTYVRLFIEGFDQGLRAGKPVPTWDALLDLCEHVIAQPRGEPPHFDDSADRDLTWHWAQHAVARFIGEAVAQTGEAELPQQYGDRALAILRALARDPDPSPSDEDRYGGDNMDPLTYSLNVVRGSVMHAIVRYALWRRRGVERANPEDLERGLDLMPGAREELDWHLVPSNDASPAIHAVYGQWFAWLVLVDRKWTEDNRARIFPQSHPSLRDAAWHAYLEYSPAYDVPFDILEPEYRRAVEAMDVAPAKKDRHGDVREHVAGHFAAVFIRGRLTWESHGRLLDRFFEVAPSEVRGAFIATLGHIAKEAPNGLRPEQLVRLHDLWARRFSALHDRPDELSRELAPFGWWYSSGHLGTPWALEQLERLLAAGGTIDHAHPVLERLAVDAKAEPLRVLRIALALIQRPPERWMLVAVDDELRAIVGAGLEAGGDAATLAQRVIDELAARGVKVPV